MDHREARIMTGRGMSRTRSKRNRINIIIGEGESDGNYFQDVGRLFDTDRINRIDAKGRSFEYIKNRCRSELKDMSPDDYLAIVIDVDQNTPEAIMELEHWCSNNNIGLYVSNPSFEVFLLMHFRNVSPNWTQDDLERELSDSLGRHYHKTDGIRPTKESVNDAIKRSEETLPKKGNELENVLQQPGRTNAHRLIQKLCELTSERRKEMSERKRR